MMLRPKPSDGSLFDDTFGEPLGTGDAKRGREDQDRIGALLGAMAMKALSYLSPRCAQAPIEPEAPVLGPQP